MRSSSTRSAPISSDPHHSFDLLQGEDVDSLDDMDDDMFDGMFGSVFGADLFAFLFSDFMRASHGGRHHRRGRGSRRGGRGGGRGGGGRSGGGGGIDADFFPFPGACTAALRSTSPPPATSLPPVACLWSCLNRLSPSTTSAHPYICARIHAARPGVFVYDPYPDVTPLWQQGMPGSSSSSSSNRRYGGRADPDHSRRQQQQQQQPSSSSSKPQTTRRVPPMQLPRPKVAFSGTTASVLLQLGSVSHAHCGVGEQPWFQLDCMKELDCAEYVTVYSSEPTMEVGADIMWRLNVSVTCCVCVLDRV
jgi:hypothetical protein